MDDGTSNTAKQWPVSFLAAGILIFSLVILGIVAFLINEGHPPEMLLRVFGILSILQTTGFIVATGRTKELAPLIGLLGTVAGYLMGKPI